MRTKYFSRTVIWAQLAVISFFWETPARAEFLEMPEIKQVDELRNKSLLRDMDIPAVKFRSPDPNEGPRLAVSEFRIQGLVEYPKLGITRDALKLLSERIRFDLMGDGKLLESGYTIEEVNEVSKLLGNIEEESIGRHVDPVEVQRLVWLIREIREKRGITLGQIETVANTITQFYRERGFVLAKAYIPKQEVRDGVVNLTVLLGTLGEVKVSGNNRYKSSTLTSAFDDMLGKPVTSNAIEEKLFLINDYPGIFVDGHFEPGHQVGDTRLNVTVKNESRFNSNIRLDNHGTDETGLYRLYGDVQWNNPLGLSDKLQASLLNASMPSNTTYWLLQYNLKLFSPRLRLAIEASENQFVVDQSDTLSAGLNLHGDVSVFGATTTYVFTRARTHNSYLDLRYETIASDLQLGDLPDIGDALDDKVRNISLAYRFDSLQEAKRRFHQGQFKLTSGKFLFGADINQDDSYLIYSLDYSLLDFWKLPFTNTETRVVYRLESQYSGINLTGIMRFSLSGPTRARAYAPGFFTGDDAVYFGLDWIFNSPGFLDTEFTRKLKINELFKPFVFFDYAYGQQHSLNPGEGNTTASIMDAGIGVKVNYGKSFSGNLMAAFPLGESFKNLNQEPAVDNMRIVFDFQYSF